MTSSDRYKDALRVVFDSQILNYGDYNLVYASNERDGRDGKESHSGRAPKYYVVGYRWQPAEIVVAPFNAGTLTPGGDPTEINMTNLSHAFELADGDYEVGTSTGKTFRFGVDPVGEMPANEAERTVDQRDDHKDFTAFMSAFVAMS